MAISKFSVSRDEKYYEAWPDLIQTKSGKLICVFTECEHHLCRNDSRIVIKESFDRGRTWSEKKALTDRGTAKNYFNCARISRLLDGRLVIICDKINGHENEDSALYLWFSDEEGENWGEPVKFNVKGIVPDRVLQLKNGRIIIAAQFMNNETGKVAQYLWYSDDNMKTWSDRVTVADDPRYHLCEVSILECENNTLVAFLRENSHCGNPMMKVISFDNGENWSPVYETSIDSGHRPTSGYLSDGRVMITYRYIPAGTQNVFAAVYDKAALLETNRKNQKVRIMPLDYDRNPAADLGYTGWTQFPDGEIYVVNYIKDDCDLAQIRGYSFYPEDIALPVKDTATAAVF